MDHPPIYTLPFDEIKAMAERGEVIVSAQGYLLNGRDRKFDAKSAYYIWSGDVDNAIYEGRLDPANNPKGADAPPNIKPKGKPVTQVLNAKGKPFSWSFTALTNFEGCPRRYAEEKFYCRTVWVDTPQIIWGNRVHKAAEDAVKDKKVTDLEALAPVQKYVDAFLKQRKLGAEVLAEMEIALDRNMKPVSWFAKTAWFRVKLDVTVIKAMASGETQANLYDYKSGKVKDDPDQLKICAAALSIIRPEISLFIPKFIWTKDQIVTGCAEIVKEEIPGIWEGILGRVKRMEQAWVSENFPARPSGLCPWCAVYDSCEYAKRR